jgi:threonine dehydratase
VSLVRVTPVVRAPWGERLVCKLENLQRTGSFKLRGAMRAVAGLSPDRAARGVVVASAGNHGAGMALAARRRGVHCRVVVPALSPAVKRARIEAYGAEVIVHGAVYDEAEAYAIELARDTGAVWVSPFDHDDVITGNGGDLGGELAAQVPDLAAVVVPVGGGGLIGGLARELGPRGIRVVGAEPEVNCAMRDSLAGGVALTDYQGGETLAEGCEGAVGPKGFALTRDHGAGVVVVSEAAIAAAMAAAYHELGQIIEPSAAVAIAAVRTGAVDRPADGTTAIVVTGGNVDSDLVDRVIAGD